jgi:hypothetical protein
LIVEGLTVQTVLLVDLQVTVVEEDDMGRILCGDPLADGAVADVVVYGIVIRMRVNMVTASSILM